MVNDMPNSFILPLVFLADSGRKSAINIEIYCKKNFSPLHLAPLAIMPAYGTVCVVFYFFCQKINNRALKI